jgi:hypothetical protein
MRGKSIRSVLTVVVLMSGLGFAVAAATASPIINSAVINLRVFNDDSNSTVTSGNNYPTSLFIKDDHLDGDGVGGEWANRHNFRLSENGLTAAIFDNNDGFDFFADVTITGPANSEGGLNISPWWSQDVDGVFTAITGNGEIAAFGGRLPFYSFNNHVPPVNYVKGETIRLGAKYRPNSLTQADPGTIEYIVIKDAVTYSSGVIPFDEGNPAEDPPHGLWGILNDAQVGGYFQPQINTSDPDNWGQIDFGNMYYVPEPGTLALLVLGGLAAWRKWA